MKIAKLVLAASFALGAAACGDNIKVAATNDGGTDGSIIDANGDAGADAAADASTGSGTLTDFVIDQITNHTSGSGSPAAFATFATLPDPDGSDNNTHAYDSLF